MDEPEMPNRAPPSNAFKKAPIGLRKQGETWPQAALLSSSQSRLNPEKLLAGN